MSKRNIDCLHRLGRRAFLQGSTLFLAGATTMSGRLLAAAATEAKPKVRVGIVTDMHHADKPANKTRHYRETLTNLAEAAKRFEQEKPDFVVSLGDLVDSADTLDAEKAYVARMAQAWAGMHSNRHFVLGNHCVESLTKPEYLGIVGQEKSYYSFDTAGYHFVILDACFTSDGTPYGRKNFNWTDANIPPAELEWLRADLQQASQKCVVIVHQCLDVDPVLGFSNATESGIKNNGVEFGIKNRAEVRKVLEASGKVLAVLQGHYHPGYYQEINGLHYCTFSALVEGSGAENNAYAMLDILPGDMVRITGFRRQKSYSWS